MKTKTKKTKITRAQALEIAEKLVSSPEFMHAYLGGEIFADGNRGYYNLKRLGLATLQFKASAVELSRDPQYAKNRKDIAELLRAINVMDKAYAKTIRALDKNPRNTHNQNSGCAIKPGAYSLMDTCSVAKLTPRKVAELTSAGVEFGFGMIEPDTTL